MGKEHVTESWIAERRAALPEELLALVEREPGRTKSHYLSIRVAEGGPRGMTDDKYAAFKQLVREGRVVPGVNRGVRSAARGWYPAGHPERMTPVEREPVAPDAELQRGLNALVNTRPGQSPSYYCRLAPAQGGLLGSQERKERALQALIQAGCVVEVPLARPVGRKTHGLYPAEKAEV